MEDCRRSFEHRRDVIRPGNPGTRPFFCHASLGGFGTRDSPATIIECPRKHRSRVPTEHSLCFGTLRRRVVISGASRQLSVWIKETVRQSDKNGSIGFPTCVHSHYRAAISKYPPLFPDVYKDHGFNPGRTPPTPSGRALLRRVRRYCER